MREEGLARDKTVGGTRENGAGASEEAVAGAADRPDEETGEQDGEEEGEGPAGRTVGRMAGEAGLDTLRWREKRLPISLPALSTISTLACNVNQHTCNYISVR